MNSQIRYAGSLTFLAGAWLILSLLFMSLPTAAVWSQLIAGIVILLAGIYELARPKAHISSWASGIAGFWMVISPMIIYVSAGVAWNQVIVGLLAIVFAIWDGQAVSRMSEIRV